MGPSTSLRDPGRKQLFSWVPRVAQLSPQELLGQFLKDGLEIGPFDFAQGSWAKAVVFLGAEGRVTFAPRIAGAILERWSRDRSFDFAQGAWAKAVVFLGAEGRVTFAPRIAGAILERWSRDRTLRLRSGILSFCAQGSCLFALRVPCVVLKISFVDRIKIFSWMSA